MGVYGRYLNAVMKVLIDKRWMFIGQQAPLSQVMHCKRYLYWDLIVYWTAGFLLQRVFLFYQVAKLLFRIIRLDLKWVLRK